MKKRGQMMSMPLIYIFAIVVAALILIWGGKVVLDYLNLAEETKIRDFQNQLETDVSSMLRMDAGSASKYKVLLTSKVKWICFYDNERSINYENPVVSDYYGIMESTRKNVFYLPMVYENQQPYGVDNLENNEDVNPLCFRSGQEYILESKGTFVEVKVP